jgi:pSer/pThr/pTyr-binding forkhead associated (FHA) protein
MWILRGRDQQGRELALRMMPGESWLIGRSSAADVVFDEALLSRLHCRLVVSADGLRVDDLQSTNGTYVNGRRVDSATLVTGDRLQVGRLELTVDWQESEA